MSILTQAEALVQDGMDRLMKGRTVFVIAHRLSTVQNADVIMVLDHGRIIERGSHEQLMAKQGRYYQMWQAQAKYYQEEQEMQERFGQQVFA